MGPRRAELGQLLFTLVQFLTDVCIISLVTVEPSYCTRHRRAFASSLTIYLNQAHLRDVLAWNPLCKNQVAPKRVILLPHLLSSRIMSLSHRVKQIENVNVPFSVIALGAFQTRFVGQAVLWLLDLQDIVSQCGVGFLLGQEVQGLVTGSTAVSVPGLPLCRLTSVAFSV